MAFSKKTWKDRQGTDLDRFTIEGQDYTLQNVPDEVTQAGDEANATSLNDLETRIKAMDTAFANELSQEQTDRSTSDSSMQSSLVGNGTYIAIDSFSATASGYSVTIDISKSGYIPVGILGLEIPSTNVQYIQRGVYVQNTTEAIVWFNRSVSITVKIMVLYVKETV